MNKVDIYTELSKLYGEQSNIKKEIGEYTYLNWLMFQTNKDEIMVEFDKAFKEIDEKIQELNRSLENAEE